MIDRQTRQKEEEGKMINGCYITEVICPVTIDALNSTEEATQVLMWVLRIHKTSKKEPFYHSSKVQGWGK